MEIKRLQNRGDADNGCNGFNILKFSAPETAVASFQPMHWVFCVDRSGSMETIGSKDGKSRMEHVKATLVRIVEYLEQQCKNTVRSYLIDIVWFNGDVSTTSFIVDANTDTTHFIQEINNMAAVGMTNMSAAIKKATQLITSPSISTNKTAMVLLSDGEITAGVSDPNYLSQWINQCVDALGQDFSPVFVGYGTEQSSRLLTTLSKTPNGEYHCVESVEGAGIVYGEIVHSALYESIKNLVIEVSGGEIYNYEKNTWESSLVVGKVPSGSSRVWHLRDSPDDILVVRSSLQRFEMKNGYDTWQHATIECGTQLQPECGAIDKECYNYYFRQQVLELLAEAKECTENRNTRARLYTPPPAPRYRRRTFQDVSDSDDPDPLALSMFGAPPPALSPLRVPFSDEESEPVSETPTPAQILKNRVLGKLDEIKAYIAQEGDETGMLGSLCDDLYVCSLALNSNSNRGLTYILARQTSQGNQRAYNATGIDDLDDANMDTQHVMSPNMVSPYASQQVGAVIREVSQTY